MAGFANDVVFANNGDFSIAGSSKGSAANGLNTNGQMWIGRTAVNAGGTHISVGTIVSPDGSLTIGYSAPNITLQSASGLGRFPITPYVVGPSGQAGYQTIQSAINAANAAGGGMVYVQPGTYTENLTFFDNIQVVSIEYVNAPHTIIVGLHTPPLTGEIAIRGIVLQSATHIFSSNSAGSSTISILECTFNITNGYIFNLPNWTGTGFNINDCGELSTNNGVVNNSGGAGFFSNNCQIGAGSANTFTANGSVRLDLTFLNCPAAISASFLFINFALFGFTLTLSGTVFGNIFLGDFFPASGPAIIMNSSGNINLFQTTINSSNNPAIAGTGIGTLKISDVIFLDNANTAGTLTLATAAWKPYSVALAAADQTKVGTCNFDSASFAVAATGFVTLTGGGGFTWNDISGAFSPLKNNGYFITGTATGTLPAAPAQGDTVKFFVDTSQILTIQATAGKIIRFGNQVSSAAGTFVSTAQGDSVELTYRESDTCWCAIAGFTGTWTFT